MVHADVQQNKSTGLTGRPISATNIAAYVGTDMLRGARRPLSTSNARYSSNHKRDKKRQYANNTDDYEYSDDDIEEEDAIENEVDHDYNYEDDTIETVELTSIKKEKRRSRDRSKKQKSIANGNGNNRKKTNNNRGRIRGKLDKDEEHGDGSIDEDEELLDDNDDDETLLQSFESSPAHSLASIIFNKLFWLVALILLMFILFYDDEDLGDTTEEDVVTKNEPYSFMGYKDQRIPDDDVAQFGGGALYDSGVFDSVEVEDEDGDNGDNDPYEEKLQIYHEKTGVYQTDQLWEDLDGYAEMKEPFDQDRDLLVFWHVPKCGGTTLQDLMMHCFGMIAANEIGKEYVNENGPLEVIQLENGNRVVNVDMSNPVGIDHAEELRFGQSDLPNVVLTSWFYKTAEVFKHDGETENEEDGNGGAFRRGRCFTMLRHPIHRAISMFYYLKDATWEHTFSEVYKNMTIEEWAQSQYAEDNWMVRFLTNEMSGTLYDRHFELAKEVLESKCLVGIMDEFQASAERFEKYFNWKKTRFDGGPVKIEDRRVCKERVMSKPDNVHSHPTFEEGGEVWNLLLKKNEFDVQLYEHARFLYFDVQNKLVE
mmetsp:Transcript_24300/g.50417  ORF Transcript_24300/g.50417 Transcript_24300/m.50417 type:complete len:595 (-) Transcript_24300:133-1917(-)